MAEGGQGGWYELAYQLVNHHVAENLFDQDSFDYHAASLGLDLFLLFLLPVVFTFVLLFVFLLFWKTLFFSFSSSSSSSSPHGSEEKKRKSSNVVQKFLFFLICTCYWLLVFEGAIAITIIWSGHAYFLFKLPWFYLLSFVLFGILLFSTKPDQKSFFAHPFTYFSNEKLLLFETLFSALVLWLQISSFPNYSLPIPFHLLLLLLVLLFQAKKISLYFNYFVILFLAVSLFYLFSSGSIWNVAYARVVGLFVTIFSLHLYFCSSIAYFDGVLSFLVKYSGPSSPFGLSSRNPSPPSEGTVDNTSSSSSPSSPLSSNDQQQQEKKNQQQKKVEKPKQIRKMRPKKTRSSRPWALWSLLAAIILSLTIEGMCDKYSPIGWSTTLSRHISGPICLNSPCFVYLLLPEKDTSNSLYVVFHSPVSLSGDEPQVRYTKGSGGGSLQNPQSYFHPLKQMASEIKVKTDFHERWVYVTYLHGLLPETQYRMIAGSHTLGWSEEYTFRTLPYRANADDVYLLKALEKDLQRKRKDIEENADEGEKEEEIEQRVEEISEERTGGFMRQDRSLRVPPPPSGLRILVGGDMGINPSARHLLHRAYSLEPPPYFAILGGDLAYENALCPCFQVMDKFLLQWTESYVNNGVIPFIPVIGNHDAGGYARKTITMETLYFYYFPYPSVSPLKLNPSSPFPLSFRSYRSHRIEAIDGYILALDSDHISPPSGEQKEWMIQEMEKNRNAIFRMVAYHNPIYPAAEWRYGDAEREKLRKEWLPLFDQYNIQYSFEFHTHRYKRTWPLKGGVIGEKAELSSTSTLPSIDGTVFIGDGCFGVDSHGSLEDLTLPWYLTRASSYQHFVSVDFHTAGGAFIPSGGISVVQAFRENGQAFDRYVRYVKMKDGRPF